MRVLHLDTVESTQDECFRLLEEHASVAVRADIQTRGRGRHGSWWHSPPGGLWLSVGLTGIDGFACAVAGPVAVCKTVASYLPSPVMIRPPNDLIHSGRKLAGILVEKRGAKVVTGFGINLYQEVFPPELNAISLRLIGGNGFTLEEVAKRLISSFMGLLELPLPDIISTYNESLICMGKFVRVGGTQGIFKGLTPEGFLVGETFIPIGRFTGMGIAK
ncbi:MAG: biotin--[acetyl-CoA-carboxylase] ligase [Candidatus Hydrothermia bacterium]